jgi:hypothetical protein
LRGQIKSAEIAEQTAADDHHSTWLEVPTLTWAERLIMNESPEVRKGAIPFIEDAIVRMERHHNLRQATVLAVLRALAPDTPEFRSRRGA